MHVAICHSFIQLTLPRFISRSRFYNASDDNSVSDAAVNGIVFYGCVCQSNPFSYSTGNL